MNAAVARVLIVEDDFQIRRFVRAALEAEGCTVNEAPKGAAGLAEAGAQAPDLVVLDLGLPDMDGVDFVRELRTWSALPVLVLSARSAEDDKVKALDAGADDYLSKPFGVAELLARVRALLRRRGGNGADTPLVTFGDVHIDLARRSVSRGGEEVHLTPIEYRLLALLASNPGKVLTHRHLLREVWGGEAADNAHYLRIYIARLRQKLEADATQPRYLLTETGVGYRFTPSP
ncbi:MAG TPA: two-component system response regulator KdpE [Rhodocyclaceae bacterium]